MIFGLFEKRLWCLSRQWTKPQDVRLSDTCMVVWRASTIGCSANRQAWCWAHGMKLLLPDTSLVQAFNLLMAWLMHVFQLTKKQLGAQLPCCCKEQAVRFVVAKNKLSDLRREPFHEQYHNDPTLAGAGQKNCLRTVNLLASDFLKMASNASTVVCVLECVPGSKAAHGWS